ncbi:hypothetical protein ABEB36_007791 [Hypothenemus hampei]|uniref:Ig-like domain-containing protein n=1 Tax=Hypothenemus hampei TaxID=57062 RepID=A0ABD1EV51_HYPHA
MLFQHSLCLFFLYIFIILWLFNPIPVFFTHESDCVRLTNMTVPPVQDVRSEMPLHCQFDMDNEQLYAVKWYKDDNEFFRYTPSSTSDIITTYDVEGVTVDLYRSKCDHVSCNLWLKNVKKPQTSGAYRCEVSTEAPSFFSASKTHYVTVAALPKEAPVIENLKTTYSLGDALHATCTSGLGDPKPVLKFYMNKQPVASTIAKDLNLDPTHMETWSKTQLSRSKIQIRMILDRKRGTSTPWNINSPTEILCTSNIESLNSLLVPHASTNQTFVVYDPNQPIRNHELGYFHHRSNGNLMGSRESWLIAFCLIATFNYYHSYNTISLQ